MKSVLEHTKTKRTSVIRDDSDETGRYFFHTEYFDDPILQRNKRIRLEGLMPKDHKIPAFGEGEGCNVRYAFSIPPDQFSLFLRDYPELNDALMSNDESVRMRAAERLKRMKPEWCITAGNR